MDSDKGTEDAKESKTAKPFAEDEKKNGAANPNMAEAPLARPDAVGDDAKKREMSKTTQRQE